MACDGGALSFLVAAHRVASTHDYFPWRQVGRLLNWDDKLAREAVRALEAELLITGSKQGETRLLPAGRRLAERLRVTHARQLPGASVAGTCGRRRKR